MRRHGRDMSKACKGAQCAGMVVDPKSKYVPDYPGATAFRYKTKECTRFCDDPTSNLCRICTGNEQKTFETGKPLFVGRKDSHIHPGFHVEGTEWDEAQRKKNALKLGKSGKKATRKATRSSSSSRRSSSSASAKRRSSSARRPSSAKRRSSSSRRTGSVAGFKARPLSSSEKRRRASQRKRGIYRKISEIPLKPMAGSASPPRQQYNVRAAATPLHSSEKNSGERLHINVREKRSSEMKPPLD